MSCSAGKSSTPILDLDSPLSEKSRWDRLSWRQALLIVAIPFAVILLLVPFLAVLNARNVAAARIFSYIGAKSDDLLGGSGAESPILFLVVCFFVLFLTIAIHELGHLGEGLAVGFHFEGLRIGPLKLAKSTRGLKIT